jgi:hypothetical protein
MRKVGSDGRHFEGLCALGTRSERPTRNPGDVDGQEARVRAKVAGARGCTRKERTAAKNGCERRKRERARRKRRFEGFGVFLSKARGKNGTEILGVVAGPRLFDRYL